MISDQRRLLLLRSQDKDSLRKNILDILAVRKRAGLNSRSKVTIRKTSNDLYAATVDDKVAVKIGQGDWSPNNASINVGQKEWKICASGPNFAVWEAVC